MAKAKLGTKRTCASCGLRYYDLNKTPIICPSCKPEFDPESLLKTRKSRHSTKASNGEEGKAIDVVETDLDQKTDETSSSDGEDIPNELDYGDDDVGETPASAHEHKRSKNAASTAACKRRPPSLRHSRRTALRRPARPRGVGGKRWNERK